MANFVIHDTEGNIVRVGSCPDEYVQNQIQPGELLILGAADPRDRINMEDMSIIPYVAPPEPTVPQYVVSRARAYPSVHDQLDCLWKAMDEGILPKVDDFYNPIKAIKDAFPKEGGEDAIIYILKGTK